MKKLRLSLLIIVLCLLGSKSQAINVDTSDDGKTLTITLEKDEHLTEKDVEPYYTSATKVIVKTKTSDPKDEETLSNLTYLVPADFEILNKFKAATTMDLHSVNYLFSDISLKGESLKYVRLRDGIKNIQKEWFKEGSPFEGAYSYSKEGATNAYCVYFNSTAGGNIKKGIFKALQDNFFKENDTDAHKLSQNDNQAHYYVIVNGPINKDDVLELTGSGPNYGAIDMSLLNAHYLNSEGKIDYADFSLQKANGRLKSIALPRDMNCIGKECLADCSSLTKIIIPDGVKFIGDEAFRDCNHITSLNIPESCTTIGRSAFLNTRLQAVKLPSKLESIGQEAFMGNKDLTTITFPTPAPNVKLKLGYHVFNGCDNLRDIYITSVAPTIGTKPEEETFSNTQQGGNAYRGDLTSGYVTFDDYKASSGNTPIFLHYPEGKGKDYGDISDDDCRTAKYTYQGREGYKKANGYMDNYPQGDQAKDWYNAHTGWSRFAFASEFDETPIPVQGPYKEGRWYTMCFPFNLTRKQIEDTFGSGTEVCNFQYVEKEQIGEMTVYSIRFNEDLIKNGLDAEGKPITPGSKIITYADKPYMIHPSQKPGNGKYQITDGDRWEYKEDENGQSEKTDQLISFDVTNKKPGFTKGDISDATVTSPAHVDAVFQGNYEKQLIPFGVFFLASNEYYKIEASKDQSRNKGYLNPYTAYVEIKDADFNADKYIAGLKNSKVMPKDASVGKAKIIFPSLWGEDDMSNSTTTAIIPVHVAKKPVAMENVRIYNLQGQLVGIGADTLKTLHNGIYVMNGKKYVIR